VKFRKTRAIVIAFLILASFCLTGNTPHKSPNIVLITIDTLRRDHLGCYNAINTATPNLDALARAGAVFENYYATINCTMPSHLSILSGILPSDFGIVENEKHDITGELKVLPSFLRKAGYTTFGVTSIFFMRYPWLKGFENQFDHFYGPGNGEWKANQVVDSFRHVVHSELSGGKFFVWLHFFDPHEPYDPPEYYQKMYNGKQETGTVLPEFAKGQAGWWTKPAGLKTQGRVSALYSGEVTFTDSQIGEVVKLLKQIPSGEETVLVIVSDHGEMLSEHGIFYDHWSLYEPSIHVPLIIQSNRFKSARIQSFTSALDIVPTVLELAGVASPPTLRGHSLIAELSGKTASNQLLISEHAWDAAISVLSPPFKLIYSKPDSESPEEYELYDVQQDPAESRNLYSNRKQIADRLRRSVNPRLFASRYTDYNRLHLTAEEMEKLEALGYVAPAAKRDPKQ
jgi:arylsulfatase